MTSEVSNKTGENVLVSYTYDDNGNLQSQLDVNSTAAVHHSYNGFNQLVSSVTGEGTITYTYNAQGIRTSRTVGLTTTHYLLDGGNVIGEVTEDETYTYVRGVNLIFGRARYYLYNAHGDVVQLTNTNGQLTKNYNYDAFGNERSPSEEDTNPFRYCGEYYDTETGLYYLRARYYDPLIGRFTQEDTHWNTANMIYGDNPQKINEREDALGLKTYSYAPEMLSILQAGNLYVYCINNPVSLGDRSGNEAKPLAFNEGVFSLLLIAVVGGVCISMIQNPPPPISIEGKLVDITSKKPQEQAVAASPGSPLLPDDDDWNHRDYYLDRAESEDLKKIINELYRDGAHIGDGGTADMLRYEYMNGMPLKHLQKATDRIRQLNKLLEAGGLSSADIKLIYQLLDDLYSAVKLVGG